MNRLPIKLALGSNTLVAVMAAASIATFSAAALVGTQRAAALAPPPNQEPNDVSKGDTSDDESLKARGPMPPPEFLPHCLQLMKQGRNAEARKLLAPVVADHPGWAKIHFYLGMTYHREHRYEEARRLFQRVTELDAQYHAVRVFYGWCLYYLGDLAASRAMFESYLTVKPDYPDAIFALGLIDFDEDDIESARGRFQKTIELAVAKKDIRTQAKAHARLADVQMREGNLTQAKASLEQSLQLNPDNYEPYFKLSRVLQRLGDAEGARRARKMHDDMRERMHPSIPTPEPTPP